MMQTVETLFFDLYGTLIRIHTDEEDLDRVWKPLCYLYGYYGAAYTPETLREEYRRQIRQREAEARNSSGYRWPEIQLDGVFAALFARKGMEPVSQETLRQVGMMLRACSTGESELYPGALELLDTLRSGGKQVFLLSNAQRLFTEPEMKRLDLWGRFDRIFISSDWGVKKPDPAYFQLALRAAGTLPERCLMVGNSPHDDIRPARELGIRTCFLDTDRVAARPACDLYYPGAHYAAFLREILV